MGSLPTSYKAIEDIQKAIEENDGNYWVVNPLKNCLRDIVTDAEYQEGIDTLNSLQEEYPNLLDYEKIIELIKKAEKRYNAL